MKTPRLNSLQKLKAVHHLAISLIVAAVAYVGTSCLSLGFLEHVMLTWMVFCAAQVGVSWYVFSKTTAKQVHIIANLEDESRIGISLLVLISTFAGLTAVFLLLTKGSSSGDSKWLTTALAVLGMFLGWFLVHTIFTVRYAHLYYGENGENDNYPKGLAFPEEALPDFIDFAYYSIVIGMTFQVSDVSITSRQMRRLTLLHSVISFVFNTCIVALTISAIAGIVN